MSIVKAVSIALRQEGDLSIPPVIVSCTSQSNAIQSIRTAVRTIFGILSILLGLLGIPRGVRDIYVNLQPWLARPVTLLGEIGGETTFYR